MSFAYGFGLPHYQPLSGGFSPASLFTGGVQGAWYDPSDSGPTGTGGVGTLFSDRAGTTPCATPGAGAVVPVGAMLDKRATAYSVFFDGSNDNLQTPNSAAFQFGTGDFTIEGWIYVTGALSGYRMIAQCAANSSWTTGWSFAIFNDRLNLWLNGNNIALSGAGAILANTWQHVAVTRSGTTVTLWVNGSSVATATNSDNLVPTRAVSIGDQDSTAYGYPFQGYISNLRVVKGTAVYTGAFTPSGPLSPISGTSLLTCGTSWTGNPAITKNGDARVDGLNPFTASPVGNHAIAANDTTARPELSARVNLLLRSEEFDNAGWTKDSCTISANATIAPDGTLTADKVVSAAATAATGVSQSIGTNSGQFRQAWFVKQAEVRYVQLLWSGGASTEYANFDLQTGVVTQTTASVAPTISAATNGFYRITLTSTLASATVIPYCWAITTGTVGRGGTFAGNGVDGFFVWGADLRPTNIGSQIPAYQRVVDANTYDSTGFPRRLVFNGTSSAMSTPANVNLSATDKVAVFAGVRKNSTAFGTICETGAGGASGSFALFSNYVADDFAQDIRGSDLALRRYVTYAAPITNVYSNAITSAFADSAAAQSCRINGIANAGSALASAISTGNFASRVLNIGARNAGASLFLNGDIYSLIVVGSAVSAGSISSTETWVNGKTGGVY